MGSVTIDGADRHDFNRVWRAYTDRKAAELRKSGEVVSIIIDPVQEGPDLNGRLTFHRVPHDFLDDLRNAGLNVRSNPA